MQREEADRVGLGKSGGGEGEGIVGALHTRRCGFVLPGDPRCAAQACQGQITVPEDGCMWERNDRRITTRGQSHECDAVKKSWLLIVFFAAAISCYHGDALFKVCPSNLPKQ